MRPNPPSRVLSVVLSCAIGLVVACQAAAPDGQVEPHMIGGTDVERGRYLAIIGGCNDCHTDGYLQAEGDVPEDRWLLGSPVGWRGPWGTTYPPNLRLSVQALTEDQCLGSSGRRNSTVLKGFHAPPMLLDTRLARARGARKKEKERSGFLMSPNPRESEATEGR